jgi:hypothetical protein
MHESFRRYVEFMHASFERLTTMQPVMIRTLPKDAPSECIYLFSERDRPLYVGRTRHLRQHSIPAARHNHPVFAFRLAREVTGRVAATYSTKESREALATDGECANASSVR